MALWWSGQVWTIVQLSMSLTYNGIMVILPGMDHSTTNKYVTNLQWQNGDPIMYAHKYN